MTTNKAKTFTADDWMAWGGAERFADGGEPVIRELREDALVIVDGNGLYLSFWVKNPDSYDTYVSYTLHLTGLTTAAGTAWANTFDPAVTIDAALAAGFVYGDTVS